MKEQYHNEIIKIRTDHPRNYARMIASKQYLVDFLNERYDFPELDIRGKVFLLYNNLLCPPTCISCENFAKFGNSSPNFSSVCSTECTKKEGYKKAKLEKIQSTNLERYGVKTNLQTKEHQEKIETSSMKKYGTKRPNQSQEIKDKISNSFMERYGSKNYFSSEIGKETVKKRMIEKYGAASPLQVPELKAKIENTNLEKYGHKYAMSNLQTREKTKDTWSKKYGVSHPAKKHISAENLIILDDCEKLKELYETTSFEQIMEQLNCSRSHLTNRLTRFGIWNTDKSSFEQFVRIVLENHDVKYIQNCRKILQNSRELDFYLPTLNIAIEVCGFYWHSESVRKDKNYHYLKYAECLEHDIKLITLFQDDFDDREKLIRFLENLIGVNKSIIGARKCQIREVTNLETKDFLKANHFQNHTNAKICYAAFYDDQMVAVMTFNLARIALGHKTQNPLEYELVRFSTNQNIPGIASKLFSRFIKDKTPNTIYSFSDNRYGQGKLYEHLGFQIEKTNGPSYWHLIEYKKKFHRFTFTKKRLIAMGGDPEQTERQMCESFGMDRIWDCGNRKWVWRSIE